MDRALAARRVEAARRRLLRRAGLDGPPVAHYRRPAERPFTAEERDRVTILFGGLTANHERLVQAALQACGYRAEPLPAPDLAACEVGRQFGNNGLCNPAYFTVGNLLRYLQQLEASGRSRQDIVDHYVFFTAGTCGPCRFGMYEAEYRLALRHAGFEGFRVLTFAQNDGVRASTGQPGFTLSLMLGLGALAAFTLGDVLNDVTHALRPYELVPGSTDAAVGLAVERAAALLRGRRRLEAADVLPRWIAAVVARAPAWRRAADVLVNLYAYLWGAAAREAARACAAPLSAVLVDRLRVAPIVKITGEFWAQTTEGDGNFRMFEFLEREGAQVVVEPLAEWVMYLLNQAREQALARRGLAVPRAGRWGPRLRARIADERALRVRLALLRAAERAYRSHYELVRRALGELPHALVDQRELVRLARGFYHHLARGGEGHLEVAKNIYYSTRAGAHMVLSLKPFGCMPSTQSDGVQSAVVARVKDMIFLPVETAPDGELNAHSRVQMALVEARARAQAEFDRVLAGTGRSLAELHAYVDTHPDLRHPWVAVPRRPGVCGVAANFALHVADLMRRDGGPVRRLLGAPGGRR
jgi:predicted nucleotide-binding protein (sugar kinase/HSP70/actin superfamily)